MGCSNPHPHGQVWSLSEVPTLPATELASLQRYRLSNVSTSDAPKGPQGTCLLSKFSVIFVNVRIVQGDPACFVTTYTWNCKFLKMTAVSSCITMIGSLSFHGGQLGRLKS